MGTHCCEVGAIRNGSRGNAHYSSSPSKTRRAAMGFSFHSIGSVERAQECWNESHTINGSPRAAKTKEEPADVNRRALGTCPRALCTQAGEMIAGLDPGYANWPRSIWPGSPPTNSIRRFRASNSA
jgi:hypothetical protein